MGQSLQSAPVNANKPHSSPDHIAHPRAIKTFVMRAGRTTTGQAKALAELGPKFVIPYQPVATDFIAACAGNTPANGQKPFEHLVLEIGFGMGDATAHIAGLMPQTLFIGCEVHEPGVGALLKHIAEKNLHNLRIIRHDAVEVIDNMLAPASLDGVHIFFPDPWHKLRHHKRRLIQPAFIARLITRLKPGGYLHVATDWQPYAEQILQVLSTEPGLKNTCADYAPKPAYRPLTKFENRGLKLGHGVWDLVFLRV
jgi:tRNA (guanine-N7-)-methyltransferase